MLSPVPIDVSRTLFPSSGSGFANKSHQYPKPVEIAGPAPLNGMFLATLGVFKPNSPIFLHPTACSIPGELGKAPQPPLQKKDLFL